MGTHVRIKDLKKKKRKETSQRNGYHTTIKMMESVLGDVKLLVMWTRRPLGRFIPKLLTNLL